MKFLHIVSLVGMLWLTGCATTGGAPGVVSNAPDDTPTSSRPAHTPIIPKGPLQPIKAANASSQEVASLSTPADLWDRIRRGFAMPDLQHELVQDREQWYASRPDYMQRMTERSSKYLFHIVEELERRGMPTELALLPYIESAFNPQAVSSAKAAGMWQFMPATGSYFDLKQNAFRDDRRDVLASTRAALDYLQKLHDMFGDWHLALAAYNWGQGNVKRAIERNQAAGLPTGYNDINMPAETRNYVPKLQAVKNIIANPQRMGAVLPLIENHPFFDTVDITQDIDVDVAARLAEVRVEDFKALNPSQRKPVIFAAGTPQILLPWNNADTFKQNLAKAAPGSLASWTAWVATETLPSRAVASRFGMDEDDFREMNNIPRGMVIKSGSTVVVRRSNSAAQAVASHVVNNAQLAYTPEIVLRRTSVRARKGDSIASVAARYDLPAATVAGWNHTNARAGLKRGQAVVLYLPVRAAAAAARDGVEAAARRERSQTATRGAVRASHVSESRAERAKASGADKGKAKNQRAGKNDRRADAKPASKSAKPSPKDSPGKSAGKGGAKAKAEPKASGKNKR